MTTTAKAARGGRPNQKPRGWNAKRLCIAWIASANAWFKASVINSQKRSNLGCTEVIPCTHKVTGKRALDPSTGCFDSNHPENCSRLDAGL